MAPHAGRDFDMARKGLFQPLGWNALGQRLFSKELKQRERIASSIDGDVAQGREWRTTCLSGIFADQRQQC